jgi:uncharacterized protein YjbI with pentapeptide repeats
MANSEHVAVLRKGVSAWNKWREAQPRTVPDLSGADLSGLRLVDGKDIDEGEARAFSEIAGYLVFPDGVNLGGANCSGANFRKAVLRGAPLKGAHFSGANLRGADARQARFQKAELGRAVLDKAALENADFTEANLEKCSFVAAHLYKADFTRARAHSAMIAGALLSVAKFDNADLTAACLAKCRLVEASFVDALMIATDLRWSVAKEAYFRRAHMTHSYLEGAVLQDATLEAARLSQADLRRADLTGANLDECDLENADLSGATLCGATLADARLSKARFSGADLSGARLTRADLRSTNFERANLRGATLRGSLLTNANLKKADLSNSKVYGVSAWDVDLSGTTQVDLVFTPKGEPKATVDDLELAQFIYLLSKNEKIRRLLDTMTRKVVLILGRFSEPQLGVLQAIKKELRKLGYLPVLFTFEPSPSRNLTETVATLASLVRFVIADITSPKSVPQELQAIVSQLVSVPVQPIIAANQKPYGMFESIQERQSVLPLVRYAGIDGLRKSFAERVVRPAEEFTKSVAAKRRRPRG